MSNEKPANKQPNHHPIKARLLIGGLKSLFGEMHDMLSELEKEGTMPRNGVETLIDVKQAIDMTTSELQKITPACCGLDEKSHRGCEECEEEETITGKAEVSNGALVSKIFDLLRDRHEEMVTYDEGEFIRMCHSLGNSLVAVANLLDRHEHVEFPSGADFDDSGYSGDSQAVELEWEFPGGGSTVLEVGDEPIKMKKLDAFARELKVE